MSIKIMKFLALGFTLFPLMSPASATETQSMEKSGLTKEAQRLIKDYAGQLQTALITAMQTGGPITAIDVCAQKSPEIAQTLGEKSAWTIGRTSLKPRNSASTPDPWEEAVLMNFEKRLQDGEDIKTIDHGEVTENGTRFRYMKAIPTQPLCLTCHGTEIDPDIQKQIREIYTDDKATGFSTGMIRGAFTLQKDISTK